MNEFIYFPFRSHAKNIQVQDQEKGFFNDDILKIIILCTQFVVKQLPRQKA